MKSAARSPRDQAPLSAVAIVPARLASERLAQKMLLRETGSYLFEHTVKNAQRSPLLERVVLATDDERVVQAAEEVGIDALMTAATHTSGTDRVHEAHAKLCATGAGPWDVILNIQGDEPELPLEDIATLVQAFRDPEVELATLWAPLNKASEIADPSVVKVVCDQAGDALYFSRASIPAAKPRADSPKKPSPEAFRRHVGVYAFRPSALERFCALPPSRLEQLEGLEQLRWLEHGQRLRVLPADRATCGIDTKDDYAAFVERWNQENPCKTP